MLSTISAISHNIATSVSLDVYQQGIMFAPTSIHNNITDSSKLFQYFQNNFPDGLKSFYSYERKLHATHEDKAGLQFLNNCLNECVLPKSITKGRKLTGGCHPSARSYSITRTYHLLTP